MDRLMLMIALLLTIPFGPALAATTLHVDDDGVQWQGAYTSIGSALLAASDGDTIVVHEGIYAESVTVGKSVIVEAAAGENRPVVDAGNVGRGFWINQADNSTVEGFEVRATGGDVILVFDSDYVTIRNNIVIGGGPGFATQPWAGISVLISEHVTLDGNSSRQSTGFGIYLGSVAESTVRDNDVVESQFAGIVATDWTLPGNPPQSHGPCHDNIIEDNKIVSAGNPHFVWDDGIRLDTFAHHNTVQHNRINASVRDGLRADGTTHDNTIQFNLIRGSGIAVTGGVDARDQSTGDGTAGTANIWKGNAGRTSVPQGLLNN